MSVLNRSILIRLARAHATLSDGARPPPAIARLARDAAMSRAHFMRRFRLVFGEPALQLSMRERLRHARFLLASSDQSVTDICLCLGYSSPATFSMLFKRHASESPSSYRRRFWPVGQPSGSVEKVLQPGCMNLLAMAWARAPGHFSISGATPGVGDFSHPKPDSEHA